MGSVEVRNSRHNTIRMNQVRAAAMASVTFGRKTTFRSITNLEREDSEVEEIAEGVAIYMESRKGVK